MFRVPPRPSAVIFTAKKYIIAIGRPINIPGSYHYMCLPGMLPMDIDPYPQTAPVMLHIQLNHHRRNISGCHGRRGTTLAQAMNREFCPKTMKRQKNTVPVPGIHAIYAGRCSSSRRKTPAVMVSPIPTVVTGLSQWSDGTTQTV